MDRIYHGCMTKNADGTNRLLSAGEKCLVPTARPFCKYIDDMETSGVKTHSQYKKQPTVSIKHSTFIFEIKMKKIVSDWKQHLIQRFTF